MRNENDILESIDISHYMLDEQQLNLVVPGDLITADPGFMNGHGTYRDEQKIYAALIGYITITNKLISVTPISSKYTPTIGDIVVGQIANKRWKVDIKAQSLAYLSLNSTYLPEQRKKNEQDQFNMRKLMKQGDYIVAEVHSANADRSYNLHTRSPKYGKLEAGILVKVRHQQIKRQKHHLIQLKGIGLIFGNNGNIWINKCIRIEKEASQANTQDQMKQISIIRNVLVFLGHQGLQISQSLMNQLLTWINQKDISPQEIIKNDLFYEEIQNRVRMRIPTRIQELGHFK